ncbi:hypothetical protein ABB02_01952 [Clostridiaceae bacterium JG1575]|nr:hypothetical protein ABB02_01952 [Clostridiaceae bacterium JG1575]
MIIELSDAKAKPVVKDLNFSFWPALSLEESKEIQFLDPIKAVGTLKQTGRQLALDVCLTTKMRFICDRCLDSFDRSMDVKVQETYSSEESSDDEDTILLSPGDTVDLADLLTKDLISSLPIQALCSESCQGLCQECGANLNREACDCDKEQVDERFAALKDYFKEV